MTDTPSPDVRGLTVRWRSARIAGDHLGTIGDEMAAFIESGTLAAALEASIDDKELDEECVVCHASLWPREGPPHCHDCHPSEEDQLDWEHGKRKPAPPPAATGDEELLARVLDVCRNQCSIEGALTLDTLATRFRVRGVDLRRMRESRDAAEKMAHLYADERNELRESLAAATARAEEAEKHLLSVAFDAADSGRTSLCERGCKETPEKADAFDMRSLECAEAAVRRMGNSWAENRIESLRAIRARSAGGEG